MYRFPPTLFPGGFHYQNYLEIFGAPQYQAFALNSIIVTVLATLITMILASLAAYAFSTVKFRGNSSLMLLVLITRMVPGIALVIPLYILAQRFGLYDTRGNLILLGVRNHSTLPLAIWFLKTSFDAVPQSILDAGPDRRLYRDKNPVPDLPSHGGARAGNDTGSSPFSRTGMSSS